jgi:hypothetical protein
MPVLAHVESATILMSCASSHFEITAVLHFGQSYRYLVYTRLFGAKAPARDKSLPVVGSKVLRRILWCHETS